MGQTEHKRKMFFANELHRQIFMPVLWMSIVPMLLAGTFIVLLIFNFTGKQLNIPSVSAYDCLATGLTSRMPGDTSSGMCVIYTGKLLAALALATPVAILAMLILVHRITHGIVGPFDRLVRELGQRLSGNDARPLSVRDNDKFAPLVERVNELLLRAKARQGDNNAD